MNSIYKMCVLALVCAPLLGCATMRGDSAYNEYMARNVTQHVYQKGCASIEPTVRDILFRAGYSVKTSDGVNIETEWTPVPQSTFRRRYLAQLVNSDAPSCKLVMQYSDRDANPTGPDPVTRDWQLELDVMETHDPAAADKIKRGAAQARECAIQEVNCS